MVSREGIVCNSYEKVFFADTKITAEMIANQRLNKKKGTVDCLLMPFLKIFGHTLVTITVPTTLAKSHKSLYDNMGDTGLEPVTPCLSNRKK
jgi:hypothetical protein